MCNNTDDKIKKKQQQKTVISYKNFEKSYSQSYWN